MTSRSTFPSILHRPHSFCLPLRLHTSINLPAEAKEETHYETYNLSPHSTHAEIKRRYFELSKVHHPDRNRNDPQAPQRFVKISTAYAILGHKKSREKYDRDLARRHGSKAQHVGPVGGRPASGLSTRSRGQLHGPLASHFRWNTLKGRPGSGGEDVYNGVGAGRADNVPHFNYGQKYRQHQEQQSRWADRARQRRFEPDTGIIAPLICVTTILVSVISIAAYTIR